MFRRLFVAAMLVAMACSACGRQVTGLNAPSGAASLPAGTMAIRFRTQGPQDFTRFQYVVVFNTQGNDIEPLANAFQTQNFANYTFALVVGPSGGGATTSLVQYYPLPGTTAGVGTRFIPIPNGYLQFLPNSNGRNTEFQLTFNRLLLNVPLPTGTATPAPGSTASAAPTATPSAAPTAIATGTVIYGNPWNLNFLVTDTSNNPLDAFGTNGVTDTSFKYTIDVTKSADNNLVRPLGVPPQAGAGATITGAEVINAP